MNRLGVGKDGKVAYDRAKGKRPIVLGVEFGEKLLHKVTPTAKSEKITQDGSLLSCGGREEEWGGMGCGER